MKQIIRVSILFGLIAVFGCTPVEAKVYKAPLVLVDPGVETLFTPTDSRFLRVSVKDQRPDKMFVGGGIDGPRAEKGKGLFVAFASMAESEVAELFEGAAHDAIRILGFEIGEGPVIELAIKEFWVDMYRLSAFSPMNCIGYVVAEVNLKSASGETLEKRELGLTYYENTVAVGSMKEISREAVSRILMQAAWQATSELVLAHLAPQIDTASLARTVDSLDAIADEQDARKAIFWLGLAREPESVTEKLLQLLRTSEEQEVHQAAAEALGMLGVLEARSDLNDILTGAQKLGGWDNEDLEQIWYLMHALTLLGEENPSALIPPGKMPMKSKLDDLAIFHRSRQLPEFTDAEKRKMKKVRAQGAKKIAKQ